MNRCLIEKYVALKMSQTNAELATAKETMAPSAFLTKAMSMPLSALAPELKCKIESILSKRLSLKPHKRLFFAPTVAQWIADITGLVSAKDVIDAISQMSGLSPDYFKGRSIGDHTLDWVFLIEIIERFEGATGKTVIKDNNLVHLGDDFLYSELAGRLATV